MLIVISSDRGAQSATTKIAIVMADPGDAVQLGLVASLARPGANITGVTSLAPELATKRLELLKDAPLWSFPFMFLARLPRRRNALTGTR
jgi:ABC-type uncharacterized transport system substrate-binding protein